MEHKSHSLRELRTVEPDWSTEELMARIARALVADGYALSMTPIEETHVDSHIAMVISTTGTSGVSKKVGLTASALLHSARASNAAINAQFGEIWSLLLPTTHIAGVNVLIRSLELGTIPVSPHDGKYPRADFSAIVPAQLFSALHGDDALLHHLQSAKTVLVGGASLDQSLRQLAHDNGINVVTTYGSTETSGGCIYDGVPLEGVKVKLLDEVVAISGKTLAHSYLSSEIELLDSEGWYRTQDIAHWDNEKIIIDGRVDDVVISGGYNVSLRGVEAAITHALPHLQIAAIATDHPQWGKVISLAIVANESAELREEITGMIESAFHGEVHIHNFVFLDALPLMGIGKVDYTQLRARVQGK